MSNRKLWLVVPLIPLAALFVLPTGGLHKTAIPKGENRTVTLVRSKSKQSTSLLGIPIYAPVAIHLKQPPRAAMLFDVDTGQVLWQRNPGASLPIASLTKIMTGLVIVDTLARGSKVRITKEALAYKGSAVGILPFGKQIDVETMLYGLLLASGNDAAIALAQRASGSVHNFVGAMNARAKLMGLHCTHYSSPDGYEDANNYSCARDLVLLSRTLLNTPRLARIVRQPHAVLPFPVKGGKIFLYNHNPLLKSYYPGTFGVKTGYTDASGPCLVAAVKRANRRLGIVLLHSPNINSQAREIFDQAFRTIAKQRGRRTA